MQAQTTVVVNEAQLAELIHEETDARPRGTDHVGQHVLTGLRKDRLRLAWFSEVKNPALPGGAFVNQEGIY